MERLSPPEHLSLTGSVAVAWRKWRQRFEIYMTASGLSKKDSEVKTSVLLHLIGPEALDVYNAFMYGEGENKKDFDVVLNKFEAYCVPKHNVTFERHRFFMRNQLDGESIDQYVTKLRILEKTCEFGSISESLVKDRLVCGVQDTRLHERLLREMDLTLDKAVAISRASETSKLQVRMLEGEARIQGASDIDFVKSERDGEKSTKSQRLIRDCPRCGRNHLEMRCPANSRNCVRCGKKGHFVRKCQEGQIRPYVQNVGKEEQSKAAVVGMIDSGKQFMDNKGRRVVQNMIDEDSDESFFHWNDWCKVSGGMDC